MCYVLHQNRTGQRPKEKRQTGQRPKEKKDRTAT